MGKWVRIMPGHYKRIGSDGKTVLAYVTKSHGTWDVVLYPLGKAFYSSQHNNYRTLAEAKDVAERLYRVQVGKIKAGEIVKV